MTDKILFVDDEENVLHSIRRELRKKFDIETAAGGMQALDILKNEGPFAVIVSDMKMPKMDGVELLSKVRDLYPDTVRLMLTGHADLDTAIEAVNSGRIFRFLTKPCTVEALAGSLSLALRQYQLIVAERDLLNKTLKGSIRMLSELLSLADSRAFSSGFRIKDLVAKIAGDLGLASLWQYEIAGLVSQVGRIAIPGDILEKEYNCVELTEKEREIFCDHPRIGAQLVGRIPRLEKVAEIIAGQLADYHETEGLSATSDEVIGSQILRAALDYDRLIVQGKTHEEALRRLYRQQGAYNPNVLAMIAQYEFLHRDARQIDSLTFDELVPGMRAAEDVYAKNGTLIIAKGQEITWSVIQGLENFIKHIGIKEPIRVWHA
jgi:response regulator RpfG family c-di-GMP phosphodiesterase